MIFQHTWQKVLDGSKTQTRKLVKPGEVSNHWHVGGEDDFTINEVIAPRTKPTIHGDTWRSVYVVGHTYAVQPGRGKVAVGRIRVTGIWCEDVRHINAGDVIAESFQSRLGFLERWVSMRDSMMAFYPDNGHYCYYAGRKEKWVSVNAPSLYAAILARPAERYQAWALTFEKV